MSDPLPPPEEDLEVQARVHLMTPRVWVTPALVAINLAVFAIMMARGVHPMEPEIQALVDWGANYGPLTIGDGRWWRLGSSMFLHFGVIHVAFNMYILWTSGPLVERLLGNVGFLLMYLIAGVVGSLASLAWHPYVVGAGASGAVFGVFGALFGFLLVRRHEVPLSQLAQLRNGAAVFVLFNVVFGMSVEGIDMAAHLGGLAGGFLCGLILALPVAPASRRRRPLRYAILATIGAAGIAAAAMALPAPEREVRSELAQQVRPLLERYDEILMRYNQAVTRLQAGDATEAELAGLVDAEIVPRLRQLRTDLDRAFPGQEVFERELRLRQEYFELVVEAVRTPDPATTERLRAKERELDRAVNQPLSR
jgi:rhomboid protease GluP